MRRILPVNIEREVYTSAQTQLEIEAEVVLEGLHLSLQFQREEVRRSALPRACRCASWPFPVPSWDPQAPRLGVWIPF